VQELRIATDNVKFRKEYLLNNRGG
jgi:hypothetical protein